MDEGFGGNRLTSKGEIVTRAMIQAMEKSFQKSRKPGTKKRRKTMMRGECTLAVESNPKSLWER